MFQYACGRRLAATRGDELLLFLGALAGPSSRLKYGLDCFNIRGKTTSDLDFIKSIDVLWTVVQIDSRYTDLLCGGKHANVALRGYWESELYFAGSEELIRKEFTLKASMLRENAELAFQITASESVCVHVRRTDVLDEGDPKGFVGLEYYETAIEYMASRLQSPCFYIFSDDIAWCSKNLDIRHRHYFVEHEAGRLQSDAEDLMLMSRCRHFIIANSTFSWWAAWLGTSAQELVIAPQRWFKCEGLWHPGIPHVVRSDDIIPSRWIRM
jgi:hypothetical protein